MNSDPIDNILQEQDFDIVDVNPRSENILAPNGNHHPSPEMDE